MNGRARRFFEVAWLAGLSVACATLPDRTAQVDAVIEQCGLKGLITVTRLSEREYRIVHLDKGAPYERVDCFLAGIKPLGLNWGFVGYESY